ncbi:protein FAR-RED IMPAIRED RESPONSE 1-like [Arachis ipaensis]|uniref:protein FAR-RED IMPAIRED RESPONSE 1-like n=1 Tax=Arachis ipaensis TaxID=130454 RepID=UPI0007AF1064|nr:protein FAR-RED IMPAIRED RESPONSE 1-like [Arachis ipaensis]XP_025669845.1 protein FAR-RED IMPAIRED RESPONSE 1-like [Arachis hypogaea]
MELSMFVRRTIETNEEAGIRPRKTYQSFVAAAGSHRELSFIEKDVRNYITREVRNVSEKDDAEKFGKYLLRMKEKNHNFFFELNLEGDHSIRHALWADARSRAACEYFGDVISFDTTYNTNRYNMVFGSFVSVNHHGQSTLLGCALMKNEDIQSFKWLFECWLRCMGAKAPKDILTDQCASMQRAIEMCMPTTIHHWYIWHIMKKIPNKLNAKRHEKMEQEMSHVVSNSFTKEAFDRNWNDFLTRYGLEGNKWLSSNRGFTRYEVVEQVSNSIFNKFLVTYDAVSQELNLLDGGPTIQPSLNFYNAPDMNYPGEESSCAFETEY